ncbi:MAG: DUF6529 family protein [Candidatus Dormibacteria bacterium]
MRRTSWLLVPLVLALAIAGGIYAFGTSHTPDYSISLFGRTAAATLPLKSWLASVILGLALWQLVLALWMYGKLPGTGEAPRRLPLVHRLSGLALVAVSVPVAYHCMFAYGVQRFDGRVAVHSIAGCFLYGAVVAKVAIVRTKRLPGWALPIAGGTLVVVVGLLWYTSALWHYNGANLPV